MYGIHMYTHVRAHEHTCTCRSNVLRLIVILLELLHHAKSHESDCGLHHAKSHESDEGLEEGQEGSRASKGAIKIRLWQFIFLN